MAATAGVCARLKTFALGFPGAYEDSPWGELVAKVDKKIFVWLPTPDDDRVRLVIKLRGDAHAAALAAPGASPTTYGLGNAGWVTVPHVEELPIALLRDWIEESFRLVAPKRRVAELDRRPSA
ncbi:MAG TPA: MmcQ/YjbR family DNA-binding protein [Candidatus Sulfotelmatobacter sp.]|nr:MmcQ/YjbR family DNA-binding protein [Candidatus Sulfotelmatobacter sp.]